MKSSSGNAYPRWSLVTNHGHVLAYVAADPEARLRDVAEHVGITERTAAQIVNDLEQAGYLTKTRVGRRNRYQIDGERKVPTPRLAMMTTGQLLALLLQALDQQPFA
jgi:DNA-binding Lrp family transcriptional regulator